jgi:NCS1 family nucleobase:cation symporter-1
VSSQSGGLDAGARAALEGSWPVLPQERTWGGLALFGVSVSTAIATWCFLIGGYVAYYLGAVSGTFVMIAGSLVGILLILLATMPVATRYGVDSIAASKPQLGTRGSYIGLFLLYTTVIGWNCLLLIFLGKAAAEILISTGVAGEGARQALTVAFGLVGVVAVWYLLRGGPQAMRDVGPIIAVSVLVLAVAILVLLVSKVGWHKIADAKPGASSGSKLWDTTTGFEIMVATIMSWWPYAGGMVRLVPSARTALWPVVFGLGVPVALVSVVGLWAGLAIPDSGGDPTTFLVDVGGLGFGVIALLFIVLANVGTTMVGVYVSAIGLKQLPVLQRRLSWNATTAVTLVPVAFIVLVMPNYFFDHIGSFLAFMGVVFGPMCGIQIVDYYFFRRQRVDVAGLYRTGEGSPYHFWLGVNPAGVLGLAAGFVTYVYLLDPVKYTSHAPYQYISATIPAAVVAAAVYAVVTRVVVQPARRGGYDASTAVEAASAGYAEPAPVDVRVPS